MDSKHASFITMAPKPINLAYTRKCSWFEMTRPTSACQYHADHFPNHHPYVFCCQQLRL